MNQIKVPFALTCKVTGVTKTYTNKEWLTKLLTKFGNDIETLKAEYISREGKAQMKGKPQAVAAKVETKAEVPASQDPQKPAIVSAGIMQNYVEGSEVCHNPAWFINKKPCESCSFSAICLYAKKRIAA